MPDVASPSWSSVRLLTFEHMLMQDTYLVFLKRVCLLQGACSAEVILARLAMVVKLMSLQSILFALITSWITHVMNIWPRFPLKHVFVLALQGL
jgi:hypothetical protein